MAERGVRKAAKSAGIVNIKGAGGTHRTVLERLGGKLQIQAPVDPLSLEEGRLWCGGSLSSEDIRQLIVYAVANGLSKDQALKAIEQDRGGPVPAFGTVKGWEQNFAAFAAQLALASSGRAEQLMEGSLEMARTAKGKIDLSRAKLFAEQARFMAARMDRKSWGELAMIQSSADEAGLDDGALDKALGQMLSDKVLQPFLKAMGMVVAGGVQAGVMAGVEGAKRTDLKDIDWASVDLDQVPLPDLPPIDVVESS